jgi:hypothetical protein
VVTDGEGSIAGLGPRDTLARGNPCGVIRGLAAVAAAALGGCTLIYDNFLTNEFSGDAFPVHVETTTGAIVVGLRQEAHADRAVVLDLLSPVTLVDPGFTTSPSVSFVDLTLLGADGAGGPLTKPRARFIDAQLVGLHPCGAECAPDAVDCDPAQCYVGSPSAPRPFEGILGADTLAGDAVRLRLGDDQVFVLPDIGGSDRGRALSCDAVFDSPYRGGGTLIIDGTELPFGNRRITLPACLGEDADPRDLATATKLQPRGSDALFVMSTSIGVSIIDETAYQRYLIAHPDDPVEPAVAGSVFLPSGVVTGHVAHIDRLSLVGTATSNPLSPCRQVYAHRLMTALGHIPQSQCALAGELPDNVTTFDCVCKNRNEFCDAPAMIELAPPARIELLVVPDDDPTLQALRTELRPDQAEVDGLLGTNVLRTAEIDVDYPHDRLIARCATDGCTARPQLQFERDRPQLLGCLGGQPTGPLASEGPSP